MKLAILTDTNSGIFDAEAKQLGIFTVPMPVLINGETFYEGLDLTEEALFTAMKQEKKISTSQPSIADVMNIVDGILKQGFDQVVYLPMSSGLSSSCQTAMFIANEYGGKVIVIDNHRISVTLRHSAMYAKYLAELGNTGTEIKQILEEDAYNSSIYLAVEDLNYLKRGGRLSAAATMIANVFGIKPILTIQGKQIETFSKIRGGANRCMIEMLDAINADVTARFTKEPKENLVIGLAGAGLSPEQIEIWKGRAKAVFGDVTMYYDPLPASVTCHTGPGAIGIGLSINSGGFKYGSTI